MSIKKNELENIIQAKFPNSTFECIDTIGDGDHWRLIITSPEFKGMTRLQKHRIVNERMKEDIDRQIHAIEFVIK
jgi:stress-induced morphogen